MLGNWSFGDYFKTEAIEWAWELLVNKWGLDPDRLYATVFAGSEKEGTEPDVEAEELWKRFLPAERVSRWDKKDNFWEMGETGPCGPCSEVHYDGRSDAEREAVPGGELVNRDHPDVIEIWNLVFIQFNRAPGSDGELGELTPLPAKHVDTGMGFERVVRVIQGKESNYDIDVWTGIFEAIREHTGAHPYGGQMDDAVDMAYRVIADHIRCLTVAINDGGMPGNEGRGYVLRRILRRAVRHAHQTLGVKGPVLHKLVPAVVDSLGDAFPELKKKPERIAQVVRDEEESFLRTLDRGIELFERAKTIAGNHFMVHSVNEGRDDVDEFVIQNLFDQGVFDPSKGPQFYNTKEVDWNKFKGPGRPKVERDEVFRMALAGWSLDAITKQADENNLDVDVEGFLAAVDVIDWSRFSTDKPPTISADDAFKLHDTYGFPIDLTRVMAEERGMTVDEAGFEKLMAEAREISRKTGGPETGMILPPDALAKLEERGVKPTDDEGKYTGTLLTAKIKAIWDGHRFQDYASGGTGGEMAIILDRTNHYAESGGQVGDHGAIYRDLGMPAPMGVKSADLQGEGRFNVKDVQQFGDYVLHIGRMNTGKLHVGDDVKVSIQVERRRSILPNHTCTHLLNLALRDVLGEDVHQRGSLVAPDRLRFDFTNPHGLSPQEIERTQSHVRGAIDEGLTVYAEEVPLDMAKQIHGLRAVFGERYPDHVRVVSIGTPVKDLVETPGNTAWHDYSIELCGGTHLKTTDEADAFVIVHEQALAAGVRRILALTGPAAKAAVLAGRQLEERARAALKLDDAAVCGGSGRRGIRV